MMLRLFGKKATQLSEPATRPGNESRLALQVARERIAGAATIDAVVAALTEAGRTVVGADGVTVIRRDGDDVVYISEDAISPLWTGQRFPIRSCISGMAMLARAPITIPDITQDKRVPMNAYLSTFVKSMVMVPIGHATPVYAMGAYWRVAEPIAPIAIERLSALALAASDAIDRIDSGRPAPRQVA